MNIKYALLLDDLARNEVSASILQHIYTYPNPNLNLRIFLLKKENIIPNPLPIFNIADYFNFGEGVTIITSEQTKLTAEKYPVKGLFIVIGEDIPGYINIKNFDMNVIEKIAKDYYAKH